MRLKKLEIIGFKSFADKTVLHFDAGITGIVGPNGCGKSNVSDAFRWVLGEQSAKSMRGGKMPDVIFAGTAQRKPLQFAEVTLTFSNHEGLLAVDYQEVAITRRLHRNGESEYLLNRQPVRLKDLHSLFMDTGIGKNSFAIMEQGKVDQVINYSPKDRRFIFEEAAGIQRFLQRKREALRKLEQTKGNVSRAKDIHDEVEKQIKVLERQARDAALYKDKQATLETLEKTLFVNKWQHLSDAIAAANERLEKAVSSIDEGKEEREAIFEQLQLAKESLAEQEQNLKKHNEAVFRARSDKEIKAQERATAQSRIEEAGERKKELDERIRLLRGERKERLAIRRGHEQEEKGYNKNSERAAKELNSFKEKVAAADRAVSALRDSQHEAQQQLLTHVQTDHRLGSAIKEKNVRLENDDERIARLEKRKGEVAALIDNATDEIKTKKQRLTAAVAEVDKKKKVFTTLEEKQAKCRAQLEALESTSESLSKEITEAKARQKALMHLRDQGEGMSSGAKRLLSESTKAKGSLANKLQCLYEMVQTGDNQAAIAALRPYGQTLVVKKNQDLDTVISFAQKNGIKDFSLLCLEHLPKKTLADHLLGKIASADDVISAIKQVAGGKATGVTTKDGFFVDGRCVVFSGGQGENNLFQREAELKSLATALTAKEQKFKKVEGEIEKLTADADVLRQERMTLDQDIRRSEMGLVEVNFALQQTQRRFDEQKKERDDIAREVKERHATKKQLAAELTKLTKEHAAAKKQLAIAQEKSGKVAETMREKEQALRVLQGQLAEMQEAFRQLTHQGHQIKNALDVLSVKEEESIEQEKRALQEIEEMVSKQQTIKEQKARSREDLGQVEKELTSAMGLCRQLERDVIAEKKAMEKLSQRRDKEAEKVLSAEKDRAQLEAKIEKYTAELVGVENGLKEGYNLSVEEGKALGLVLEGTIDAAEKQVRSLRRSVEQANDVNMTSIEEFEKHKVRYQFLQEQIGDLNESQEELEDIIAKLDEESRQIFGEVFEKIRANFRKNFEVLFSGGEADLRFVDSNDVLEAGIDIVAKPPGKQMRSIHLLSGGEKCLTATALLFAIFEVRSAPFCILDEIDAPLDDTNVERFLNVVKQFIDRTQFIIITHNKRTMAIADQLLGISMQEKGVSKLLRISFNHVPDSDVAVEPQVALVGSE